MIDDMQYGIATRPSGGLGNRLLAILSTLRLAELYNWPCKILWPNEADCKCHWKQLFENSDLFIDYSDQHWNEWINWSDAFYPCDGNVTSATTFPVLDLGKRKKILVRHCGILSSHIDPRRTSRSFAYDPWVWSLREFFSRTKVKSSIVQSVMEALSEDHQYRVGFHVRRPYAFGYGRETEDVWNRVSLQAYVRIADHLLSKKHVDGIFLCTNCPDAEAVFKSKFGDRICFRQKRSIKNWEESEAVSDALIDLILLSMCCEIIGTEGSTFSYLSAVLGVKCLKTIVESPGGISNFRIFNPV
jgi:hypothetical protein